MQSELTMLGHFDRKKKGCASVREETKGAASRGESKQQQFRLREKRGEVCFARKKRK